MLKRSRLAMGALQRHSQAILQQLAPSGRPVTKCQCAHAQQQRQQHMSTSPPAPAKDIVSTRGTRRVVRPSAITDEPPLVAHGAAGGSSSSSPRYTVSEMADAVSRFRRRLERATKSRRTVKRLEGLWHMYGEIRRSCGWRMGRAELRQFLQAVLRVGRGVVWGERASKLVWDHGHALDPAVAMALLRVLARAGDVQRFDEACRRCDAALGARWAADADAGADADADAEEYQATRAIL
ncbi:hypothetical protein LPJ53_006442, partial [Coemansia erecta]